MDEVVEDVAEQGNFGVETVVDVDGDDADIGDEDTGYIDTSGGSGCCCFSSKLCECSNDFAFFAGLIRQCKELLLILLLLLRLTPVTCI